MDTLAGARSRRSARSIAWSALATGIRATAEGPRLPADLEIAYYLSHLATGRKRIDRPEVAARLTAYTELARSDAPVLLPLITALDQSRRDAVATEANAFLRARGMLGARGALGGLREAISATAESMRRRRRRRAIAACPVVVVTGADGVGKSTVIARLCGQLTHGIVARRFKGLYRHHPFYKLVALTRTAATVREHGHLPKNQFDELHAAAMFRLAQSSWRWFSLGARLFGRRCLDRGFSDLLFDGLRGATERPRLRPGWQALAARMPQPGWHIHLDAPDEVILARKRELGPEALSCYRDGMCAIVGIAPAPAFSRIETSGTLESVDACLRLAATGLGTGLDWRKRP